MTGAAVDTSLTRRDGEEFLNIAHRVPVETKVEICPLEKANTAPEKSRSGELCGNAVLKISS